MRPVLSRAQMQTFDRLAIERGKLPSLLLMENAGRGATQALLEQFPAAREALICAGRGNNGGDGWVVARHLCNAGLHVRVFTDTGTPTTPDAMVMRQAFEAMGGELLPLTADAVLQTCHKLDPTRSVLVDALFGTGLSRPIEGPLLAIIRAMNETGLDIVSLDIPSGLDADTGRLLGAAVRARLTVCFAQLKLGLLTPLGSEHVGALRVAGIGASDTFLEAQGFSALLPEAADLYRLLPPRASHAHKVNSGRVMVAAGSPGKLGAAHLVAAGALRAGAGLVTLVNTADVTSQLQTQVREVMTETLNDADPAASLMHVASACHSLCIGPGLGVNDTTYSLVRAALELPCVKVLDADALSVFVHRAEQLKDHIGAVILTPHPGEAGRLLGVSATEVEENRYAAVAQLVALTGSTVLLKGTHTLIGTPDRLPHVCRAGSRVLATGGSGDVLTGIVGALAVHVSAPDAALLGASLHALAGERWQARHGSDRGMLASEIAEELPEVIAQLSSAEGRLTL